MKVVVTYVIPEDAPGDVHGPGYRGIGHPARRIAPQPTNKAPEGAYARQEFQPLRNEMSQ